MTSFCHNHSLSQRRPRTTACMPPATLRSDPKEECGAEKRGMREEGEPIQGCTCGHLGLMLLRSLWEALECHSNCVLSDRTGSVYLLAPMLWSGMSYRVCVNTPKFAMECFRTRQNRWKGSHSCPYRRQQSSPEQKVRHMWCRLGAVPSDFICTTLQTTARLNTELGRPVPGPKTYLIQL